MEILVCPKCRIRVAVGDDYTCPSCRASLNELSENPSQDFALDRNGSGPSEALASPYLTPRDVVPRESEMAPNQSHFDVVSVCFSLEGRIPRSVYWFTGIGALIVFFLSMTSMISLLGGESTTALFPLLLVAFLWSQLAISVKRFHDIGMSGYWFLLLLLPGIGQLVPFFVLGLQRGTRGENRYGRDPLENFGDCDEARKGAEQGSGA